MDTDNNASGWYPYGNSIKRSHFIVGGSYGGIDTVPDIEFIEFATKHPEVTVDVEVWESPALSRDWDRANRRSRDSWGSVTAEGVSNRV